MLRDSERAALAEMAIDDDGPDQADPDLLAAIRELTAAVKAIKAPEMPKLDVKPVAAAVAGLAGTGKEIAALRSNVRALTEAVASIKAVDLSGVAKAIAGLEQTQKSLIEAIYTPKEIVCDASGQPMGLRPIRMN